MRSTKLARQVRAFMQAAGQTVRDEPTAPTEAEVRLRARLILEEAFEFLEAVQDIDDPRVEQVQSIKKTVLDLVARRVAIKVDMPHAADALADIDYVVEGGRQCFGIDGDPIADEVHRANMSKMDGPVDEHGKKLKPLGWQPPDIAGCLLKQRAT